MLMLRFIYRLPALSTGKTTAIKHRQKLPKLQEKNEISVAHLLSTSKTSSVHQLHITCTWMARQHFPMLFSINWRAPWKNRICCTTMKLRKSLIKPVMRQKTCNNCGRNNQTTRYNYNVLFSCSARENHS